MTTVRRWTGHEAKALRAALRLSVRAFAEHLGVSPRAISKWEAGGTRTAPRPDTQAILDTALSRADTDARRRFELLVVSPGYPGPSGPGRRATDYESWEDDLDRATIALGHQDFTFATDLVERWLLGSPSVQRDDRGRHLIGRSLSLLGGIRRDQGVLAGPRSATTAFQRAREVFTDLGNPRRTGQCDLALAVVAEMNGDVPDALRGYRSFALDERLRPLDQILARVWAGRALSKLSDPAARAASVGLLTAACEDLERHDEAGHWAFAQQKLALAYRAQDEFALAVRHVETVLRYGLAASPMQRVRLVTAHAHVLAGDEHSGAESERAFNTAHQLASRFGLGHQLASINAIRADLASERSG